jgi:hypothetical protein
MPWGFLERLDVRLLIAFLSSFGQTARFEGSVDAVSARSLAMLGIDGYIRLLLHGVTRPGGGKGYNSAASTLEDNGRPLEDIFYEMFSRY